MKWKKIGQIFDPTQVFDGIDRPWMKYFSQCTSSLVFDNFIRVYFSCRPEKDENDQAKSYTTFVDLDRKNLRNIVNISNKPVMPLGELGAFDEFAVYPTSVIKHNEFILLYYAGWTRCQSVPFNTSIGLAISNDGGTTFNRKGPGPILSADINEPFVISGPKIRKFNENFYLYYLAGIKWINHDGRPEIIYKNRMAISSDGIKWDRLNKNIIEDILDENECQAGPDVFYLNGKYHMYFVFREGLNFRTEKNRGYKIGYATSLDAINWKRDDENGGIGYSETGWDSEMQHYPHVFELDGKYYMTYNGNEFGKYGFGLAVLENEK
jgi:predicted GH43/DUF377 family glycosyl hydrolase